MEAFVVSKNKNEVFLNTELGSFRAFWCSTIPVKTGKCVLELDSDEILFWDLIQISEDLVPYIESKGDFIYLNGLVEEYQDDAITLRLGNCIMLLQTDSETDFSFFANQFVRIVLSHINVYDIGP